MIEVKSVALVKINGSHFVRAEFNFHGDMTSVDAQVYKEGSRYTLDGQEKFTTLRGIVNYVRRLLPSAIHDYQEYITDNDGDVIRAMEVMDLDVFYPTVSVFIEEIAEQ